MSKKEKKCVKAMKVSTAVTVPPVNRHCLGISDELFIRGKIPMTKQEVRILALAKAKINPDDIVLDIGAGTGSLSVEAALLASRGQVVAVEREAEGISLIKTNAIKFGATNLKTVQGSAPAAMADLPAADVIFIGGSGGQLAEILASSDKLLRPGGRLLITAVTVETLASALRLMAAKEDYQTEACGVQITHIRTVGASHMFQGLNPIYIIAAEKKGFE